MSIRTLLASFLVLALGVAPAFIGSLAHAQDDAPAAEAEPAPEPEADAAAAAGAEAEAAAAAEASERDAHEREAASSVETALEQLRTAHIGEIASRTRSALQDARPLLRPTGALTTITREIEGTERTIGRLAHPSRVARIPRLSQRELADARATWRRHADLLDDWQHSLTGRITELEEARAALVEIRQQWAELRNISEAAGSPEGRHERILASLIEARTGAEGLDTERARIAGVSDRVTDLQILVADVSDQLRDAASAYHERLTVRDAPPIYAGLTREGTEEASMVAQARESFLQRAQLPEELLREVLPSLLMLGLFFGLVVALLGALGRGPRNNVNALADAAADAATPDAVSPSLEPGAAGPVQPAPPPPEAAPAPIGPFAREVLARPIAAATLLTLIGASFAIEHAPIVVYDAIFFAILIPLWRAVPPLCRRPVGLLVKGAIVFAAVDRVQAFLPEGTASLRVVLLLEAIATVAALAYWLRSEWGKPGARTVRTLVSLALVVLLAAFVANLAGYVFFATVLSRGTGFAAYSALTYAGAVIVIEAIADLFVASPVARRLRSLREHPALAHRQTLRILTTVATLGFLVASLDGYGLWGAFASTAEDVLGETHEVGTLSMSLGALLRAILVLVLTSFLLRFIRFVLELDLLPRLRLEPGVDGAISGLTRYLVGGMGLLLALASLGIDTAQIALVAGALGVGIGFGLQGIVANFIAGIVLMIERPVRLGDFVEVGTLAGVVERIGLRSSTVRALDGAEVIVPNESLISREVTNWTLSDRMRRVAINIGVAYGSDPHVVLQLLRGVVDAHAGIIQLDKARFIFEAFGESSLDFKVLFWAGSIDDAMRLRSEVGVAVFDALKNAGIEIPFPQREVRVIAMPDPPEHAPAAAEPLPAVAESLPAAAESLPAAAESLPAAAPPPTTKTPPKD